MTAAIPALAVVGLLVLKGAPALSPTFLFSMPLAGMTAGGILFCIVGTLWLVGVSLSFAVPVGVLAGIYLSEYAGEGWLPRVVDLAIVNLAGVPSIVYAQVMVTIDHPLHTVSLIPYVRGQMYDGGKKFETNAPSDHIREVEAGAEWQLVKPCEVTLAYVFSDRTYPKFPYDQQQGQLLRAQVQVNY